MKEDREEQEFLAQVRRTLDGGNDALDGSVRNRLTQARMTALEQGKGRPARRWLWLGAPLTAGLAMAVVVAFLLWRGGDGSQGEGVADLEIITAAEAPDFYADLEFYQWLAEGEGHAGG